MAIPGVDDLLAVSISGKQTKHVGQLLLASFNYTEQNILLLWKSVKIEISSL